VVLLERPDLTGAATLHAAIERQLPGIVTTTASGDWYLFYDPDGTTDPGQRFPFCTLMTGDRYDAASRLDRDAATYRVNLGVGRRSYEGLFGPAPREAAGHRVLDTGFDYTATDTWLPHPFYAPLHWVCVVNPGERTRPELAALLGQAHELAQRQYGNRRGRHR
jgi:uncharacterized protein DUF6194